MSQPIRAIFPGSSYLSFLADCFTNYLLVEARVSRADMVKDDGETYLVEMTLASPGIDRIDRTIQAHGGSTQDEPL